jgi:hypothetical protein
MSQDKRGITHPLACQLTIATSKREGFAMISCALAKTLGEMKPSIRTG